MVVKEEYKQEVYRSEFDTFEDGKEWMDGIINSLRRRNYNVWFYNLVESQGKYLVTVKAEDKKFNPWK